MKKTKNRKKIIVTIALLIIFLLILIICLKPTPKESKAKIALIKIEGPITSQPYFFKKTDPERILDAIKKAKSFDGILLFVNSNGGSAASSFKITNALKKYKTNKPVYAYIDEYGLSGAYLIASTANKIYANPLALVGSIGVMASYLEVAGLLEKYNITYQRLVKGEFKDIANPLKHLTLAERKLLESKLEIVYNAFINEVAVNRNKSIEEIKKIASGEFFIGEEAKTNGLVDQTGYLIDLKKEIEKDLNKSIEIIEIKTESNFLNQLKRIIGFGFLSLGYGIGQGLSQSIKSIDYAYDYTYKAFL